MVSIKKIFTGYFDLLEEERKQQKENQYKYEKYSGPKSGTVKENLANELLFEREQEKAKDLFERKKQKENEPDFHNAVFGEYNPYFQGNQALTDEQQVQLVKDAYNAPKGTITELRQDFQTFTKGFAAMAAAAGAAGQPHVKAAAGAAAGVSAGITGGLALYEAGYDHIHAFVDKGILELKNFINRLGGAETTSKSLKEIYEYNKEVAKQEQEVRKLIKQLEKERIKLEKANTEPEQIEESGFDIVVRVMNAIEEFNETVQKYISFDKPLPALFDESYHAKEQTATDPYLTNIPEPAPIEELEPEPETKTDVIPIKELERLEKVKPEPKKKTTKT